MFKRIAGMIAGAVAGLFLLLAGCMAPDNGNSTKVPVEPSSMFFERSRPFCSEHIDDRFLIGYFGDEVLENTIHFFVISHTGDTIYRDHWAAKDWLAEWESGQQDKKAKEKYLQERMQALVDGTTDAVRPDSLDAEMEFGPVFRYRHNLGEYRTIAFSRARKSVVVL